MDGWTEEQFISYLYIGELMERMEGSSELILDSYALAQEHSPNRVEAIHHAVRHCRTHGRNQFGYILAKEGINKKLECQIEENNDVEIHNFPNFIEEAKFVANKIKEIAKNESQEFSDFAILIRANSHSHAFIEELKALGIPYQVKNPKGLFNLEEIKDLISVIILFFTSSSIAIDSLRVTHFESSLFK